MKKYIIAVATVIFLVIIFDYLYFHLGIYLPIHFHDDVYVFAKTEGKKILLKQEDTFREFEIRGVDLGSGCPGEWSTDFAIDKETYKRWFSQMQAMGINTVRIYTIQSQPFYDAFYEYNKDNKKPLYLLHGVWVNDHVMNSYRDAYHDDFYETFTRDCKIMVDIIHGNRKLNLGRAASAGHGSYLHDISQWVIGYILGVEWEDAVVAFTDDKYRDDTAIRNYKGTYFSTASGASAFEAMLVRVADRVAEYETKRYGTQRLMAFANWPTTDPFEYPEIDRSFIKKCAKIDVEHIVAEERFLSGHFASYHVYPYFPDYLTYVSDWSAYGIGDESLYYNESENLNTYRAYLTALANHHSIPVIISEFGIPTSRAMAHMDVNTGRNQGAMSEQDQGEALVLCYEDIMASGCAGSCIFSWQDEWFKRTWNTLHAVDLKRNPYWSDYQTNEQFFGIMTFDPGANESVCYVDGDVSEWTEEHVVTARDGMTLSSKYDEKYVYIMVNKNGLDIENDTLYIPIDVTPKTGSNYCENYNLKFNRDADFIIVINGRDNSRVVVQERYEALRSTYAKEIYKFDTYEQENIPDVKSPLFKNIDLILHKKEVTTARSPEKLALVFETGKLRYGNANPHSPAFDSLADFAAKGDNIEIKLPWQLLNFSDPSRMYIHDDYYSGNYGIQSIPIDEMFIGICRSGEEVRVPLASVALEGWGNDVSYHERLKESYYVMQNLWAEKE